MKAKKRTNEMRPDVSRRKPRIVPLGDGRETPETQVKYG
jgi:hypothetical protein